MTILSVEDEPHLAKQIVRALEKAGHAVISAANGVDGLSMARSKRPDVILLDVNLPGRDGFEILEELRGDGVHTRVLMLTARDGVVDRVMGLRIGADDYLTKPFAMEELLARVEALGRRTGPETADIRLRSNGLELDVMDRKVWLNGELLNFSPREFEVLNILMREPGRVFSRDELCEKIWQREHLYDTRTVEIFIMRLRKKLEDGASKPFIETVRGIGYRFVGELAA